MSNDQLPSLTAREPQDEFAPQPSLAAERRVVQPKSTAKQPWLLWLFSFVLLLAMAALAWWYEQQLQQLRQQIIATQDSFARISEDASGHFAKVSASVTDEQQRLNSAIKDLQQLQQQQGQQISRQGSQLSSASKQLERFAHQQTGEQQRNKAIHDELTVLQQRLQLATVGLDELRQKQEQLQQQQELLAQGREQQKEQYQQVLAQVDSIQELIDLQSSNTQGLQSIAQEMLPQLRKLQGRQDEFSQELAAFRAQTTRMLNDISFPP